MGENLKLSERDKKSLKWWWRHFKDDPYKDMGVDEYKKGTIEFLNDKSNYDYFNEDGELDYDIQDEIWSLYNEWRGYKDPFDNCDFKREFIDGEYIVVSVL